MVKKCLEYHETIGIWKFLSDIKKNLEKSGLKFKK